MTQHKRIKPLHERIHDGEPFYPKFSINTKKMIKFIEKYGVDCIIDGDCLICHATYNMTFNQIDILFSYKPNFLFEYDDGEYYLFEGICNLMSKSLYILRKMIEYDVHFILVTAKMCTFIKFGKYVYRTYLEYLYSIKRDTHFVDNKRFRVRNRMIILLENHQKKYYTLFQISLNKCQL